ncbi:MAG: phospholipid/cholesterol/gamma-HCH transport system substrate-binding protein [Mycobacterium sp.]|nr:phospholipid/cholesterol/gamma-HCH transport system substrate-binding protein [Mycobacterium sp.]
MSAGKARAGLAVALVMVLIAGLFVALRTTAASARITVTAYFDNSNGIYAGDEVRILGVPVGKIDKIEPQPQRAKITFWYDSKYRVPADAKAAILSPSLVAVRAIQLTPAYTGGPALLENTVIPLERTAVPMVWDDFRQQLLRLTEALQPTQSGGVSTLGAFVNTAADNLRGQGTNIRETLIKVSRAFSALGDHSKDIFSTVKNVSILVSALQASTDLMRQLNQNLAAVTTLLSNSPNEVGNLVSGINGVVSDVTNFVANNRETLGTTSDKLASVTTALNQSLDDLKQTLHVTPTAFQNLMNIYHPATAGITGLLAINQFANPINLVCSGIQAASRLGAEQSAKLCAQYLAPIIKNRQYNFPPLGENLFVGAAARPNELTYTEDWLRPDYVPPPEEVPARATPALAPTQPAPLPAESPVQHTDPAAGLPGMMVPPEGGP